MSAQRDWAQDYDLFDPEYAADPYPIWAELRTACPVAHTDRYGGSWLTTTYDDVTRVARDPATFSSRDVGVIPPPDDTEAQLLPVGLPPIQADPPDARHSRGDVRHVHRVPTRTDLASARQPSVGLFLDLEVRLLDGPLFVSEHYDVVHTIVGMSESRRTESFWTQSAITPAGGGTTIATVLLHQGVFKDSFPDYPREAAADAPA